MSTPPRSPASDPEPAPSVEQDWFAPERLFARGYPEGISSALRLIGPLRDALRENVLAWASGRVLEVGPGDAPLLAGVPVRVYLDRTPFFLRGLSGARVIGDLRRAPFRDRAFGLVVMADILTHIPPVEREAALHEAVRLAPTILIFNPEPGTPEVLGSPVSTDDVCAILDRAGLAVSRRDYVARAGPSGRYGLSVILAVGPPV